MDKLQKLQEVLKTINDSLTREEFTQAFKLVTDFVKQAKQEMNLKTEEVQAMCDNIMSEVKRSDGEFSKMKKDVMATCMTEVNSMLDKVEQKMSEVKDGEDADENLVIQSVLDKITPEIEAKIPTTEDILNKLPELGLRVRDSLELLPEGEKLKIEAIEKLREELDDIRKLVAGRTTVVGGIGGTGGHTVKLYDLSSQLDGVTKTFSLPTFWRIVLVTGSSFPNALRPDTDYTVDGSAMTITFTSQIDETTTLASGQTLLIQYSE